MLTYADGTEIAYGDKALLSELKLAVHAARSRYARTGLSQDYRDIKQAKHVLRSHCRSILSEGCPDCDEYGEIVVGWKPATQTSPREARYQPCPECGERIDAYLEES